MTYRFDVGRGRIEYDGLAIVRLAGEPLIPRELWDDDRLSFREGLEPVDDDLSGVPDDLRDKLERHGYWPDTS